MTVTPVVLSVNVGLPKNVAWQGKTVYTGASAKTSSSRWTCRPTRAPTSAGRPRS
jgi:hypothetical protein